MQNSFYMDLISKFRENLRKSDNDSLIRNIEMAGIDVILDPELLSIAREQDERQVVILISSLGEANSNNEKNSYRRILATYQYLQNQISIDDAAFICKESTSSPAEYYSEILKSSHQKKLIQGAGEFKIKQDDLLYGIELLINTGNSLATISLLKIWHKINTTSEPWLRTCRAAAKRASHAYTQNECSDLANTIKQLISIAPDDQKEILQVMRNQCAEMALKSKNGMSAYNAALEAFQHCQDFDRRYILSKAQILKGDIVPAITNIKEMINFLLVNDVATQNNLGTQAPIFDVTAAEDSLVTVNKLLKIKGIKPFLMSGTLLGYARDGALLPHDKDIDLGILGWENQFAVAEALLQAGHYKFDVAQLKGRDRFLISANDLRNGMAIDFFFFHDKHDHYLHGIDFDIGFTQNFKFSKFGLKEVDFLNDRFFVPDNIDKNLTENYGSWKIPESSYVVTVESPALCESKDTKDLLICLELLKTILRNLKPNRIDRILNHVKIHNNNLLDQSTIEALDKWSSVKKLELMDLSQANQIALTTNDKNPYSNIKLNEIPRNKIKIGFLIHALEIFNTLETIIDELLKNQGVFELYFFALPRNYSGNRGSYAGAESIYHLMSKRYKNVAILNGVSKNDIYLLQSLELDYLFRQSPWDNHIPALFSSRNLSNFNLSYIPYGFMTAGIPQQQYNQAFHNYCKFIFCESEFHFEEFRKHRAKKTKDVYRTGYPRFELMLNSFKSNKNMAPWPIKPGNTLPKIIWAPHHSIGKNWLNYSTFLQYKDMMLEYAKQKKISILFRPHPALREKIISSKSMTNTQYEEYLNAINATESSKVDDQYDYIDTFAASDYMITDGVGFFSEYLLTGKPLIHTRKSGSQPLNDIGQWMMDAFRKVDDANQLNTLLNEIATDKYIDQERPIRLNKRAKIETESIGAKQRIIEILQFNSAVMQHQSQLKDLTS